MYIIYALWCGACMAAAVKCGNGSDRFFTRSSPLSTRDLVRFPTHIHPHRHTSGIRVDIENPRRITRPFRFRNSSPRRPESFHQLDVISQRRPTSVHNTYLSYYYDTFPVMYIRDSRSNRAVRDRWFIKSFLNESWDRRGGGGRSIRSFSPPGEKFSDFLQSSIQLDWTSELIQVYLICLDTLYIMISSKLG